MDQSCESLIFRQRMADGVQQKKITLDLQRVDCGNAVLNETPRPSDRNTFAVIASSPEGPAAVSSELVSRIANGLHMAEGRWVQVQPISPQEAKLVDVRLKHPIRVT